MWQCYMLWHILLFAQIACQSRQAKICVVSRFVHDQTFLPRNDFLFEDSQTKLLLWQRSIYLNFLKFKLKFTFLEIIEILILHSIHCLINSFMHPLCMCVCLWTYPCRQPICHINSFCVFNSKSKMCTSVLLFSVFFSVLKRKLFVTTEGLNAIKDSYRLFLWHNLKGSARKHSFCFERN